MNLSIIIMLILKPNKQSIRKAVEFLKEGKVIVYPTETCYALGCDVTNEKACKRILEIKKRSKKKKSPIIIANLKMTKEYAYFNKDALKLVKVFWPGPLTLLLKKKRKLSRFVGRGIRVSSNPIARELSKKLKKPIVATSANISGRKKLLFYSRSFEARN